MSKIVYLIEQPLDERNYDRFGIQAWIERGWSVEVWDLTPVAHPRVWEDFLGAGRNLKKFPGYFPIRSAIQLKDRYAGFERNSCFIDLTGDNRQSLRVKMRLSRMGAVRVVCAAGATPEPAISRKRELGRKLGKALSDNPARSLRWLTDAIARKLATPLIRPGLVIVSGEQSIPRDLRQDDRRILRVHNLDYDIYLKLAGAVGRSSGDYAVFIDQDYCFHPDFIFQGIPFLATPERYFPAIRNGLKRISETLGLNLRVAAHPRASYFQRKPDYFGGIPIEYGKTAELIGGCKVVVCHNSTAIQFAVLFGKPLIFLTTDELNASIAGDSIAVFASELGKSVINVDGDLDNVDWRGELNVDAEKYPAYRRNYIKCEGSPESPHWDVVIDRVERDAG